MQVERGAPHARGETVERFRPAFNCFVIVEGSEAKQSSDAGLVRVREVLERTGLFAALSEPLDDPRVPERVTHSLADQLRTVIGLLAQGWGDLADGEGQAEDAVRRVATRGRRGLAPLHEALPSPSTLSRLLSMLAAPTNRAMLHEATVGLAGQRLRAANNGHRKRRLTLAIDGAALPVAGHQAGPQTGHKIKE